MISVQDQHLIGVNAIVPIGEGKQHLGVYLLLCFTKVLQFSHSCTSSFSQLGTICD